MSIKKAAKNTLALGCGVVHGYLILGALGGCLYLLGVVIDLVRSFS